MPVAGAGWSWVRGPAIERVAAATPSGIVIESPSVRARRLAAIALAKMPDDPSTLAESPDDPGILAESAAASAASASDKAAAHGKENCGFADAPQFARIESGELEPAMTRAARPRYLAAQARIDAALRLSADPLDHAAADFVNAGDMRTAAGSDEAVVQQAAVSSDPRVVALGHAVCAGASVAPAGCAALTAERWAQVDAGNGIPWLEILAQARARGDAAGMQQAMSHLAGATRFDRAARDIPGAVARRLSEDDRDLMAGFELVGSAGLRGARLPFPAYKPLLEVCSNEAGGDEQRALQCRAISDAMYAHSDEMISFLMSGILKSRTTGDASWKERTRAEIRALGEHWTPDLVARLSCGVARDWVRKVRRSAEVGELEAMREEARKFVTP